MHTHCHCTLTFFSSGVIAGYVPDTDSETGTLTANSPTDQAAEKQLNRTVKCKQSLIGRGDSFLWANGFCPGRHPFIFRLRV